MKYTNILRIVILFLLIGFSQIVIAQVQLEANEGMRQVMWSPDGTRLITANPNGEVRIWDESGQLLTSFVAHPDGTRTASWSPDGTRLATGGAENVIKVWDNTGNLLSSITTKYEIFQIAWHPDNSRIVVLGFNILDIWDTSTGQFISFVPSGTAMDMAWSPDGMRLASVSRNDYLDITDATTYQNLATANTPNGIPLNQVAWSPDNNQVITGNALGEVRLWDANDLSDIGVLAQVDGFIQELAYSPDGSRIAIAVDNGFVYIVDANISGIVDTIITNYPVLSVDWKPDGSEVAFVGVDEDSDPNNDIQIVEAPPTVTCDTTIVLGDVTGLISAIDSADNTPEADTLCLEAGTYTLSAVDNSSNGDNGLPQITTDITLVGLDAGATLYRDNTAAAFRHVLVGGTGHLSLENIVLVGIDIIDEN